jgi:hypothetical protein
MVRKACAAQQSAEPHQQEAGLMNTEAPKHSAGIIAGVDFKILANAGTQQIHQI